MAEVLMMNLLLTKLKTMMSLKKLRQGKKMITKQDVC